MSYYQLPPNSQGMKIATRPRVEGIDTVYDQAVFRPGGETYYAYADAVAFAANKHHISLFNGPTSGKTLQLRKLFAVNLTTAAVAGIAVRFDIKMSTAQTLGTAVPINKANSQNATLPAQITCATGATVTEGNLLYPYMTLSEELTATQGLITAHFQQSVNILLEADTMQELTLRPGEGFTLKQITSSVVGSFGWLIAFTSE